MFSLILVRNSHKWETHRMREELQLRLHNLNNWKILCQWDTSGCAPLWASRKPPPEPTGEWKQARPRGITEIQSGGRQVEAGREEEKKAGHLVNWRAGRWGAEPWRWRRGYSETRRRLLSPSLPLIGSCFCAAKPVSPATGWDLPFQHWSIVMDPKRDVGNMPLFRNYL